MKNYKSSVDIYRGKLFNAKEYFKDFLSGTQNAITNVPSSDTFQLNKLDVALDYFKHKESLDSINDSHRKKVDKGIFVSSAEFEKLQQSLSKVSETVSESSKSAEPSAGS